VDLPTFIAEVGDAQAAKLFNVTPRAAASWRYGTRRPRPEKAWEIERVTKGRVRFVDIYREERRAS
jgi:DNA-binding transcriptional regulator YdaS (Cro superfamily)